MTKNISDIYLKILKKNDQKYFRNLFEDFEKKIDKNISEIVSRYFFRSYSASELVFFDSEKELERSRIEFFKSE